jgi:polyhydroxyalkanoate synthesis regulator phasin
MGQKERKDGIRARLRRASNTAVRAAEVMSVSPMEDLSDRIDRLEQELMAMREKSQGLTRGVPRFTSSDVVF